MDDAYFISLITRYKSESELLYKTWFLNSEQRLKAFRNVRSGVQKVIGAISEGIFPNDLKGSPLEQVLNEIINQREIFEGAKHAFMWKPKLRIPDIYENEDNKRAFGSMLGKIIKTNTVDNMLIAVDEIAELKIKGLGPSVSNILYFLEPQVFPPFNTAIVNGYNLLTGNKIKLGSWTDYFKLRDGLIELNKSVSLSTDLGAISGFFFDVGSNNMVIPENAERIALGADKNTQTRIRGKRETAEKGLSHYEMQYLLGDLGNSIGYHTWIAANDHSRSWNGSVLGDISLSELPLPTQIGDELFSTISLIDVIWFNSSNEPVAAFEIEKSTSIYSGMLRLDDLATCFNKNIMLYIVSPAEREKAVCAQFQRPHFIKHSELLNCMRYILFEDLRKDCEAMKKFGKDHSILEPISHFANCGCE